MSGWVSGFIDDVRQADREFKAKPDRNPVAVVAIEGDWSVASVLGELVGCSVVGNTVIGTRASVELFMVGWKRVTKSKLNPRLIVRDMIDVKSAIDYDPRYDRQWVAGRANRLQLFWVAHKVAELFPDLRDWEAPSPPEVTLKRSVGTLRLGGVDLANATRL